MKNGFTLIELLVYMAIMGFIIVVAGRAFSDSTSMRVRTQSMTKATEETNRVAEIIKEDLSQMGAKAWAKLKTDNKYTLTDSLVRIVSEVYVNPLNDKSSFILERRTELGNSNRNDRIEFLKISYDNNGEYIGTRRISWELSTDKVLRRRCVTRTYSSGYSASNDPEANDCPELSLNEASPVIMADGVQTFALNPSKSRLSSNDISISFGNTFCLNNIFGSNNNCDNNLCSINSLYNNGMATLSGFTRNTNTDGEKHSIVFAQDGGNPDCKTFEFKKDETYAVKFKTPMPPNNNMMALFNPDIDHIAVGFRRINGNKITGMPDDFMFYPPQDNEANSINQYFEFSLVPDKISKTVPNSVSNVCIAFISAFYSGSDNVGPHKGELRISNFELLQKKDGVYDFERENLEYATTSDSDLKHKEDVKAFELILEINKKGEVGSTRKQVRDNNDNVVKDDNGKDIGGYIIPVPNNGIVP